MTMSEGEQLQSMIREWQGRAKFACEDRDRLAAQVATLTADLARVTAERDSAIREWGRASGERDNAADSYVFLMRVIEAIESGSVMVAALTGKENRWVGWRGGNPKHFATAGEAYRWIDEVPSTRGTIDE
jgi:hypothetical protein